MLESIEDGGLRRETEQLGEVVLYPWVALVGI